MQRRFNKSTVLFVDILSKSFTDINIGLSSIITQQFGETEISQLVNAYKASTTTLGDVPLISFIIMWDIQLVYLEEHIG